jgi:hypothetical protein
MAAYVLMAKGCCDEVRSSIAGMVPSSSFQPGRVSKNEGCTASLLMRLQECFSWEGHHGLMVVWIGAWTQDMALLLFGMDGLCDVLGPHLPFIL